MNLLFSALSFHGSKFFLSEMFMSMVAVNRLKCLSVTLCRMQAFSHSVEGGMDK